MLAAALSLGFGASPAAAQASGTGFGVNGYVVAASGDTGAEGLVTLERTDGAGSPFQQWSSTGNFVFEDVPNGDYLLSIRDDQGTDEIYYDDIVSFWNPDAEGSVNDYRNAKVLTVNGSSRSELSFAASGTQGPAIAIGRITDSAETPSGIAGARVTLTPVGFDADPVVTETNAEGRWSVDVTPGEYIVTVDKAGWRMWSEDGYNRSYGPGVPDTTDELNLDEAPAVVSGRVLAGGQPVAGAELVIYPPGGRSPENPDGYSGMWVDVDPATGEFSVETSDFGPGRLEAWAPGFAVLSMDIDVQPGGELTGLALNLQPFVEAPPTGPQSSGDVPVPPAPAPAPAPAPTPAPTIEGLPAPKGKSATPVAVNSKGQLVGLSLTCATGQACGTAELSYQGPAVKKKGKGKKVAPKPVQVTTVKNGKLVLNKAGKALLKKSGRKGLTVTLQVRDAAGNVVQTVKVKLKAETKKKPKKKAAKK